MDGTVVVAVDLMRGRVGVRAPSFWLRAWFWLRTRAKVLWFGLRCWAAYLWERLR